MINDTVGIVLGAGKGTRMKSELPKVLHPINGIPMIKKVINTIRETGIKKIFVVIGYKSEMVKEILTGSKVGFLFQKEQLGTAHAVLQGEKELENYNGDVLVVNGDSPLIGAGTIKKILKEHKLNNSAATILTCFIDNPEGYGRILRTNDLRIKGIVEDKEASDKERKIKEINVGVYCFNNNYLFPALKEIKMDNKKTNLL